MFEIEFSVLFVTAPDQKDTSLLSCLIFLSVHIYFFLKIVILLLDSERKGGLPLYKRESKIGPSRVMIPRCFGLKRAGNLAARMPNERLAFYVGVL